MGAHISAAMIQAQMLLKQGATAYAAAKQSGITQGAISKSQACQAIIKAIYTPASIRKAVKARGCTIDIEKAGGGWLITLDAPTGKLFVSSGCHVDCGIHGNGWRTQPDWACTYANAMAAIDCGFLECDDPDCEFCLP